MSMNYGSWSRTRSSQAPRTSSTSGPAYPEPTRAWGYEDAEGGPREPSQGPRGFEGRDKRLLGILKDAQDPCFNYFELQYLQWIYKLLTEDWALVQRGTDLEATSKWVEIFLGLELDQVAQMDMMLLAQQSASGRALANEILWLGLTTVALERTYEDLSPWFTRRCHESRKHLDRPPRTHRDRGTWSWANYSSEDHSPFSPLEVPHPDDRWSTTGDGGAPLMPPRCWQRPAWAPSGP